MNIFLIALGANLPLGESSPANTLESAAHSLIRLGLDLSDVSRFYRTPCFPAGAGPDYVNAAARVEADLTPEDVLHHLHDVEREHARDREVRWGRRTLDLDLIAAGGTVLPDRETFAQWANLPVQDQINRTPEELILPHPRLQDRAFVLVPLRDIAPDWVHPVFDRSVSEMCDDLPEADLAEIVAL